jgi:hypothetical protein
MRLILVGILASLGLANATVSAAPADPAASPATNDCPKPATPVSEAQRKFHPGHYVSVSRASLPQGFRDVAGKGVAGVQVRYRWAELEPEQGQYQFAAVARDLEDAKRSGLQFVAMIEDKTFANEMPTPAYLQSKYTVRNGNDGYTALRWDPFVSDRLKQLAARLGDQFDCDPNFEGVAFQETSLGIDDDTLDATGYTPEKYRDALIDLLRSTADRMPRSRVFWYMNFLPRGNRYIGEVATAVIGTGVVMGGPDVLPDNKPLASHVYPYYDAFRGRLKLFGSMQHNSFRHRHAAGGGYWSMEDLYLFARDRLHVDYLFWDYHTRRVPPDSHDWSEAREVIARHAGLDR